MINTIKEKYRLFSDAVITKIQYFKSIEETYCVIGLRVYNWEINQYDEIELVFEECIFFRFFESVKINSTIISHALLEERDEIIVMDFFPLYYTDNKILENLNSDFIIKSKNVHVRRTAYKNQ